MVFEDKNTLDVHAESVGGWPKIAHPLLNYTKSLDYSYDSLPKILQDYLKISLRKILYFAHYFRKRRYKIKGINHIYSLQSVYTVLYDLFALNTSNLIHLINFFLSFSLLCRSAKYQTYR